MIPSGRPSVDIAADLVPGVHDALIELRESIGPRAANRVILHVGELLIPSYPLMVSDMLAIPQAGGETVQVKIKLTKAASPVLMQCYESLGHGVRGATLVNLLNRLYMLSEAQPELVEEAVKRKLQKADSASQVVETGVGAPASAAAENLAEASVVTPENYQAFQAEEIVLTGLPDDSGLPGLSPGDDPLSGINFSF